MIQKINHHLTGGDSMSNSEIPGDVRPHPTTDNTTGPSTAPKPPPGRKNRDGARILDRNDVPMAQVDSQGSRSGSSSSPRKQKPETSTNPKQGKTGQKSPASEAQMQHPHPQRARHEQRHRAPQCQEEGQAPMASRTSWEQTTNNQLE